MLRSHKKNILIGVCAVGLFGLIYGFLNSRPEMIADESLRVSEEPRPEFDHVLNRTSAFKPDSAIDIMSDDVDIDDSGVSMKGGSLVSAMQESLDSTDNGSAGERGLVERETISSTVMSAEGGGESLATQAEVIATPKDPYVNPFKSGPKSHRPEQISKQTLEIVENVEEDTVMSEQSSDESFINLTNSEVPLLTEQQSGFLDLNLGKSKSLGVVLLEGDDIIIDDVNEGLGKFKPHIKEVLSEVELETANPSSETGVTSVAQVGMDMVSPFGSSATNKAHKQSSDLIVLPDPDYELMNGTDDVSLEYQASYKKLESITDRLKAANEENHSLKNQFSKVADDNRKLAQIIRDIDEKIKVLTVNN